MNLPPIAVPTSQGETVEFDPSDPSAAEEDVVPDAPPGTVLEIKHLHEVFDQMKNEYIIKPAPADSGNETKRDGSKYAAYAFTVIRRFIPTGQFGAKTYNVTTFLEVHSAHLVEVGKEVIGQTQGISWTAKPLRVRPLILSHVHYLTSLVRRSIHRLSSRGFPIYRHIFSYSSRKGRMNWKTRPCASSMCI